MSLSLNAKIRNFVAKWFPYKDRISRKIYGISIFDADKNPLTENCRLHKFVYSNFQDAEDERQKIMSEQKEILAFIKDIWLVEIVGDDREEQNV